MCLSAEGWSGSKTSKTSLTKRDLTIRCLGRLGSEPWIFLFHKPHLQPRDLYVSKIVRLNTIVLVVVIMFAIYLACSTKLIGFHYPEIVNDQPFVGGIRITSIEGLRIKLENGLLLKMENDDSFKHEKVQMAIGDLVKIETDDNENFQIHARVNG